jgi:hypothetical protein
MFPIYHLPSVERSNEMNRREFLKAVGSAALLPLSTQPVSAASSVGRCRPSDPEWPSNAEWGRLNDAVGGRLIPVEFPLSVLKTDATTPAAEQLWHNLKNPYFIGEQPGLTQTMGWVDAWVTRPSVYAVAAESASDIAAAVNFARENNLRLVIKGGGHSYQGTSNAADSLLIWTRHMNDVVLHSAFVPQGCEGTIPPQPAVTVGAGTIGIEAYDAVTTKGGKYVQAGGCLTVGVAGLVQSGGFGSFSKHYGTAAGSLLEAEVVTADGQIRTANACRHSDLFWALKGGGGGTFGVVSSMTLRLHDLPRSFGIVSFTLKAVSDDSYRRLIREFMQFYTIHLFNHQWGEQARLGPDNTLEIEMLAVGLDTEEMRSVWRPFADWVEDSPDLYSLESRLVAGSVPAQHFWDVQWWTKRWPEVVFPRNGNPLHALLGTVLPYLMEQPVLDIDKRSGAQVGNVWWKGNTREAGWFIWGFESLWLPQSLLEADARQRFADALFASSRHAPLALHFNKGLAGAPPAAIAAARDTAMNPAVLDAFALAIAGDGQGPAYPGVPGHAPSIADGRIGAARVRRCMAQLRALVPDGGAYVSESNYFEAGFQRAYWGANYPRLAEIKRTYDPDGLFFVHNGVGSDQWSEDGFMKL